MMKILKLSYNKLTSWAMHKQPDDITVNDLITPRSEFDAYDKVIFENGRVEKILKDDLTINLSEFDIDLDFDVEDDW